MKKLAYFLGVWLGVAGVAAAATVTEGFESGLPTTAPGSPTDYSLGSGTWNINKGLRSTTRQSGAFSLRLNSGSSGGAAFGTTPAFAGVSSITFFARGSGASTLQVLKSVSGGAFTSVASRSITSSFASYTVAVNEAGSVRIRLQNSTSQSHYIDDLVVTTGGSSTPTPTSGTPTPTATPTTRPTATPTGATATPTTRPTSRPTSTPTSTPRVTPTPGTTGEAIGFGRFVTGGAGGTVVTVTNSSELSAACRLAGPTIIQVVGNFNSGNPRVFANKTIVGIGANAGLIGGLYLDERANNVIIKNLTITSSGGGDGITIRSATNVWVDHCTFFDCADGSLDMTVGADNITVSWCKFYYTSDSGHNFVNLIGASDSDTGDLGKLHITMHHNWWSTLCVERMPSVRFGRVHVFNNYFNTPGNNYAVRTRLFAEVLVENNYFEGVNNAWEYYITEGTPGLLRASGNVFVNTAVPAGGADTVFVPPYPYSLDTGSNVKSLVMSGAGPK